MLSGAHGPCIHVPQERDYKVENKGQRNIIQIIMFLE